MELSAAERYNIGALAGHAFLSSEEMPVDLPVALPAPRAPRPGGVGEARVSLALIDVGDPDELRELLCAGFDELYPGEKPRSGYPRVIAGPDCSLRVGLLVLAEAGETLAERVSRAMYAVEMALATTAPEAPAARVGLHAEPSAASSRAPRGGG